MQPSTERAVKRWSSTVGLVCVCAAFLHGLLLDWTCDDAFISFRYAENLVEGRGLVFNEGERVEGITNIGWTLWLAAGMRLGVTPEVWSSVWGLILYALGLALLWR